ncbi:MAG: cytochrome c oxidase subunit II [Gemmatimonadales bacterium]
MPVLTRLRRLGTRQSGAAALTVALAVMLAACGQSHPDSIFHHRTDVNRDVDFLFKLIIWLGTFVFVIVESILVITLIKFRQRPGQPEPKHVHGNTTLEITWTVVPLLVLIVIAIPTIRTIFKTQATAVADALQVEVIGHQWWWEFRYPQYTTREASGRVDTVVTANELYLPIGKTVNFTLHSHDVIHSFWVPALSGKRDVVTNHTNYLWYTPDSSGVGVWNGACVEYCGTSHGNMRFKAFTVTQADFDSWIAHQEQMATVLTPAPGTSGVTPGGATALATNVAGSQAAGANTGPGVVAPPPGGAPARQSSTQAANASGAGVPNAPGAVNAQVAQAGFIAYPRDKLPAYTIPQTPFPAGLRYNDALLASGNAAAGEKLVTNGICIACHTVHGEKNMAGIVGPNLTHLAIRTTIAAGLYPNDAQHLARWVKDAPAMKQGVIMPALGLGEYDPVNLKGPVTAGGFTDQQIADIVAYLQTLK